MVNVTNRPNVAMRLAALEFLLGHFPLSSASSLLFRANPADSLATAKSGAGDGI
jgi:hypothetical protein